MGGKKKLTTEEFVERANIKHNNKYNYSETLFVNTSTKVKIICPIHGEFLQRADMHLHSQGCRKCGLTTMAKKLILTTEEFIKRAISIHGDKYDYSKTEYINSEIPLKIICKEHGEFLQLPDNHTFGKGKGCPECGNNRAKQQLSLTTEEFVKRAEFLHKDKNYSYHKVEYINNRSDVVIHCMETDKDGYVHGDFLQHPGNHLAGQNCPKCGNKSTSKGEQALIKFLKKHIEIEIHNRSVLYENKEIDIFIPTKKIGIEYNGLYWHSELSKDKNYHLQKTIECSNKEIKLIHVFEDEWNEKQNIVESRLLNILGLTKNKIYARKTEIKILNIYDEKKFLNENHIQGYVSSTICYGLYYNNVLVSLMSFGNLRKNLGRDSEENKYELLRFSNKLDTTVIGGASKMFKYFIKKYNPIEIISYADLRWSTGNLYEMLGFSFIKNTVPNYFYLINGKRKNRFNFRKDILVSKYGCSLEDTEHNFCFKNRWYRIYDCGAKLYKYSK